LVRQSADRPDAGRARSRALAGDPEHGRDRSLHPQLVALLAEWTATNLEHIRAHARLIADHRGTVNRHSISRTVYRIGRIVGVEVVHPHRPGTPWPPR